MQRAPARAPVLTEAHTSALTQTGLRQAALIRTRHTGARTQHAHTLVVLKIKKSVINRTLSFAHATSDIYGLIMHALKM